MEQTKKIVKGYGWDTSDFLWPPIWFGKDWGSLDLGLRIKLKL